MLCNVLAHLSQCPFKKLVAAVVVKLSKKLVAVSFLFLLSTQAVLCSSSSSSSSSSFSSFTPCNYPVPSDATFQARCGTDYLHSTYICDVDKQISITGVEKINSILSKYDLYSRQYVRVGIAVVGIIEYPNWADITSVMDITASSPPVYHSNHQPVEGSINDESIDPTHSLEQDHRHVPQQRVDRPRSPEGNNWSCLSQSQIDYYRNSDSDHNISMIIHYLQTFTDLLRHRWFNSDCQADVLFLAVTQSVISQSTGQNLLRFPSIRVSFSQELLHNLPSGYDQELQNELTEESEKRRLTLELITVLAVERIAERLDVQKFVEREMSTVLVDGSRRVVTAVLVHHTIPLWAIYTFIGCLGSVGLALGFEWTIVRRRALTLRGNGKSSSGGGGAERQRSSKSDNVQVHLYF